MIYLLLLKIYRYVFIYLYIKIFIDIYLFYYFINTVIRVNFVVNKREHFEGEECS